MSIQPVSSPKLHAEVDALSTELKFLIRCHTEVELPPEALNDVDWEYFVELVESHRVISSLYPLIEHNRAFPDWVKNQLKTRFNDNKLRMLTYTAELLHLIKLFKRRNIASVPLKGPMLSYKYHGDFMHRVCRDIDLLLEPDKIEEAYELLYNEGYRLAEQIYHSPKQKEVYLAHFHHYCLYNEQKDITVELHWRLLASNKINTFQNAVLWKNARTELISGIEVSLLSDEDNFLYLCIHGGRHQWKRLFWLLDIVTVLRKENAGFITKTYQLSKQRGISMYVLQALQLASILFNIPLPKSIVDEIAQKESVTKVSAIALFYTNTLLLPDNGDEMISETLRKKWPGFYRHFTSSYYLGDMANVLDEAKSYFINPQYWSVYAFPDSLFLLNYLAAPFFWGYHFLQKLKK